jgi:hypothetical protein
MSLIQIRFAIYSYSCFKNIYCATRKMIVLIDQSVEAQAGLNNI